MEADLPQYFILVFSAIFFVVDPFAAVPLYIAMTRGDSHEKRRKMALRASITSAIVLIAFAFLGKSIFSLFGITLPAFKVAGGVLLFLIAIDMVRAQPSRTRTSPEETREGAEKDDIAIIPMAIPMLSGPGSIATVMVLTAQAKSWQQQGAVVVSILLTALASYLVLRAAQYAERVLKQTGLNVLTRLMGMVLCAIAVQFIASGAGDLLPGLVAPR
ncbi:MAG: MarC family protein [Deltaproteobacteria bacterium]|nr:MarC family protein [Deltaproteobacteria bacterium]